MPKLLLFCSGTLIRLATGFCVALANAAVSVAAGCAAGAAAFAPVSTGVSCAATESDEITIVNQTVNHRMGALPDMNILLEHTISSSEKLKNLKTTRTHQ